MSGFSIAILCGFFGVGGFAAGHTVAIEIMRKLFFGKAPSQ